ncbi:MAG: hypothetical protein ABJH04_08730 [Cyclobacteriaceae bacterium]|jgi:hypothetical protein
MKKLIKQLEIHQDIAVHKKVNQFYYMEQIEELTMIIEQSEAAYKRALMFSRWMEASYLTAYENWQRDARWVNQYLVQQQRSKPIL